MELEHTDRMAELMIEEQEQARAALEEHRLLELLEYRAARALSEAKDLIVHVRRIALEPRTERGEMLRELSAPMPLQKVDDADEFWAQLIDWVTFWGAQFDRPLPAAAAAARAVDNGDVQAFRAGTTPEGAGLLVGIVATQLQVWRPDIMRHASARVFFTDVAELVSKLRSRYPQAPRPDRPVSPRACPVCGEHAVGAWWDSGDEHDVEVRCAHCSHVIPVRSYGRMLDWVLGTSNCLHRFPDGGGVCEKCFAVVTPDGEPDVAVLEIEVRPPVWGKGAPTPVRGPRPHRASNFSVLADVDPRDETRPVCGECFLIMPCGCGEF